MEIRIDRKIYSDGCISKTVYALTRDFRCVRSLDGEMETIVNQSLENIEIILVDDGSPDRVPEMCDEWANRDARIKVIHKATFKSLVP